MKEESLVIEVSERNPSDDNFKNLQSPLKNGYEKTEDAASIAAPRRAYRRTLDTEHIWTI